MHLLTAAITVFFVWKLKKWQRWRSYHSTMLYYALCNMIYNFITQDHYLWTFQPDPLSNNSLTEMVYTLIVFPGTVLLYLNGFPQERKAQIVHIVKWILIYITWEWVFLMTNRMDYQYGWNLAWSAFFDCLLFPMLVLHHKRPLLTYLLSIPITIFFIWFFHVPFN